MAEKSSGHGGVRPGAGRPKGERGTTLVRAPDDLARMMTDIVRTKGGSVAGYLDRKLRATVEREHKKLSEG